MTIRQYASAVVLLAFALPVLAETVVGTVIGIADGDTLAVLDRSNQRHKIRLQGIDAPEKRQAWGRRSMQNLAALAFHQEVTAECGKIDRYGREVCKILVGDRDVNLAQIESGMAWWYRAYAAEQNPADRAAYQAAETAARDARRGLWADPDPQAPWDWRRAKHPLFRSGFRIAPPVSGVAAPNGHFPA